MSKMLTTYQQILEFAGCLTDSRGNVEMNVVGHKEPLTLDGLRVCLPTEEQLASANPSEKIIFHPLRENLAGGESKVLGKLREVLKVRINYVVGVLATNLIHLAASPDLHRQLSPDQLELVIALKDADEKTAKALTQMIVAGTKLKADKLFVDLYLNRGGSVRGQRFSRAGIVSFPFLKDLDADEERLYGVKWPRAKDRETVRKLFLFMFPNADVVDEYSEGSLSRLAPFLEALLRSALRVAGAINDLVEMYGSFIDDSDALRFPADWVEVFDELDGLAGEIRRTPPQAGNDGHQPPQAAAPAQTSYVVPPAPTPTVQMNSFGAPVTPVAAPVAAPSVVNKSGKADFKAIQSSAPGMALMPNPLQNQINTQQAMQYQQYQQQQQQLMMQQQMAMQAANPWAVQQVPMAQPGMPLAMSGGVPMPQPGMPWQTQPTMQMTPANAWGVQQPQAVMGYQPSMAPGASFVNR